MSLFIQEHAYKAYKAFDCCAQAYDTDRFPRPGPGARRWFNDCNLYGVIMIHLDTSLADVYKALTAIH